jgi:hypothetical protein
MASKKFKSAKHFSFKEFSVYSSNNKNHEGFSAKVRKVH